MKLVSKRGSRQAVQKPTGKNRKQFAVICALLIVLTAAVYSAWHLELLKNQTHSPHEQTSPPDENPDDRHTTPADSFDPDDQNDSSGPVDDIIDPPQDNPAITAEMTNVSVIMGYDISPDDFISAIHSESRVTVIYFANEPETLKVGEHIVEIAIEDVLGNREIFTATLRILDNDIPPIIVGTQTIESMRGNPIIYRQGVSAYDTFGRPLDFDVDSSDVDQDTVGVYTVIYSAVDIYGLITEVEILVHVINIDPDLVNEQVDDILEGIFTDDMTQVDQAQAIFTWIRDNISYAAMSAAPRSAYDGAYRALRDRRGGCTIYSSISYVMLTRAKIPTLRVDRVPEAPTRHRWNLINPDELGWHHFDSFPILLGGVRNELYMFTDSHAQNFTRQMASTGLIEMYFTYDPQLYPQVVYE
ncbi:MAG: transglutaminase-like domain-containing protein [Oscillospiraceae bacterium]|jgi:transglutaminase-like putative cysteine protease|nr:transglutaminase-like domain-containing protein [Oscillospiraceae bacterium]